MHAVRRRPTLAPAFRGPSLGGGKHPRGGAAARAPLQRLGGAQKSDVFRMADRHPSTFGGADAMVVCDRRGCSARDDVAQRNAPASLVSGQPSISLILVEGQRDRPRGDVETFCRRASPWLGEAEFMKVSQGENFLPGENAQLSELKDADRGPMTPCGVRATGRCS